MGRRVFSPPHLILCESPYNLTFVDAPERRGGVSITYQPLHCQILDRGKCGSLVKLGQDFFAPLFASYFLGDFHRLPSVSFLKAGNNTLLIIHPERLLTNGSSRAFRSFPPFGSDIKPFPVNQAAFEGL